MTKGYLDMELLRFTTAGSVDDGKSTLIGRLLYDSKAIFEDQLASIKETSERRGNEEIDLSLFTDGLRAEREQGITIDVAYRYFATPKRKFIIADTPGHIQYTRNMVTGASTANVALILVDARNGVIEQTLRHSYIANLLQIPHVIICINKMDLVDYSEETYQQVKEDYEKKILSKLEIKDVHFVPVSAKLGDNVVKSSEQMNWYKDETLMHLLETIKIQDDRDLEHPRFPVQYVIRPQSDEYHDYRGYAGRIAGGVFSKGNKVKVLPSGRTSEITSVHLMDKELPLASAPQSVSMTLKDDLDISRGDMIVGVESEPKSAKEITVMLCWMNERPLQVRGKYTLRHTTNEVRALVSSVNYKMDINRLEKDFEDKTIEMNDIAEVSLKMTQPIFIDSYKQNRITGSLILVDESTNETVAAGMIL
ncbi:sulfate adenylyltransferase subunit 1 [Balneicella halophila]|uniref:sulfate adenylyltransferase n=1 Tax=Balneicella halophila TaxID=1537566 RepID=A0A7L4UP23_BALHA|nr:GTP-binding protein [Balneicella halophila]PVX50865.1 sulfate adenylyltransferase subunit 1 [Balneicella halophila]